MSTVTALLTNKVYAWRSETPIRSRRESVVLVDEPAEQVPPMDIPSADRHRVRSFGERGREVEPAMRPAAVVVGGVGPERAIEVPPTEDDRPVEALGVGWSRSPALRRHSRSGPGPA